MLIFKETAPFEILPPAGIFTNNNKFPVPSQYLNLEFQTKDAFIGLIKSEITTIQIPFSEIEDLLFNSNFFTAKLRIQLKTLHAAQDFPATQNGEIKLSIARKNRKQARSFASSVGLSISQYVMMKDLQEDLEL